MKRFESIWLSAMTILSLALLAGCASHAPAPPATQAPAADMSPKDSLTLLKEGNARFVAGTPSHPRQDQARRTLTVVDGQHPFAAVLACADSRVGPELVFDQGVGDLFVVRVAGNVAAVDEIGSIEYAVEHLHAPLIVVLGHGSCGAVSAAIGDGPLPEHIAALVAPIKPAVTLAHGADASLTGEPLMAAVVRWNVEVQMQNLLTHSQIVREHIEANKVQLVGGVYDLATGNVEWLGQSSLKVLPTHGLKTDGSDTSTTRPELLGAPSAATSQPVSKP